MKKEDNRNSDELDRRQRAALPDNLAVAQKGGREGALRMLFYRVLEDQCSGNEHDLASDMGSIGQFFFRSGEIEKAEHMFLEAMKIHQRLEDSGGEALDHANLSLIHRKRHEIPQAMRELSIALELLKDRKESEIYLKIEADLRSLGSPTP